MHRVSMSEAPAHAERLRCVPNHLVRSSRKMGKFLAARCSSERPGPFRDNAGSHCPLHGS